MGPFDFERQQRRAELIASILLNKKLDKDAKRIWNTHLAKLARTEDEYNARAVTLYGDKKWNQSIGTLLLTS
jgi:predicted secreted Zn-dependent protease